MNWYTFLPTLLNMSVTASVVILFVIFARLLLRKAPKIFSYVLWYVVLFRLFCPVAVGSSLSLLGILETPTVETHSAVSSIEYIPANIVYMESPEIQVPVPGVSDAVNRQLPQGAEQLGADPLEFPITFATYIWGAGFLAMAVYSVVACFGIRKKLKVVILLRDNIFIADDIKFPFVIGLFRPRIYLPCGLGGKEQEYIILHEQHHIRRLDHIVKALAFLALCIHWFNPLVWLAFILMGKDMEMSCDEAVIRKMGENVRADYSASLLALATGQRRIAGAPLAFGEGDTKGRIRNLANWRKPGFWVVLAAVAGCAALAVCLLTNPISGDTQDGKEDETEGFSEDGGDDESEPTAALVQLTIDDVAALSEKGDALSWSDFEKYSYMDVGSGLIIKRYEVDEIFSVLVGGNSLDLKPMYITLSASLGPHSGADSSDKPMQSGHVDQQVNEKYEIIDIRYEDVWAFVERIWYETSAGGTADVQEVSPSAVRYPDVPMEMLFASGAGAWGTTLTLQPDGTFTGEYYSHENGENTSEYPYGTIYICRFSGRFSEPTQTGDYAFSMYLEELTTEEPAGREWIEENIRYITAGPLGIEDGEEFILYAPGIPADELSEEFRGWWPDAWNWRNGELSQLNCWGLCNVNTGKGFFEHAGRE